MGWSGRAGKGMGDGRRKVGGDGDDRGRERVPLFSPDYKENGRNNVNKD